jgi:hypothetical protein
MRVFIFILLLLIVTSCATKKDSGKRLLPEGIKSATEELYSVVNSEKRLLQKKQMVFTKNGRIKHSKTVDSLGNLLQETEKKLFYSIETYPGKEPYYCKTRWKPNGRERISCYTRKQYKQNEAIYYYNANGTIAKIVDTFTTFYTQYFYYTNNELTRIVTKDNKDILVDDVSVHCETRDAKGACLKEIRVSKTTNRKEEICFYPIYK